MSSVAVSDVLMSVGFAQHHLSPFNTPMDANKPCKPCTFGRQARFARFKSFLLA
jgi:hypothetical protein